MYSDNCIKIHKKAQQILKERANLLKKRHESGLSEDEELKLMEMGDALNEVLTPCFSCEKGGGREEVNNE